MTLSGFADRGVGSVTVKVYAGSVASGTPVATLVTPASGRVGGYSAKTTLADGTYTAQAQQTNDAGIVRYCGANTFTVDTTPPGVSLSSPTNGSYTGTQPRFSGSGGTQPDDSGSVTVKLYNGSTVTCCAFQQETTTVQADGSYSVASLVLGQGTYTARAQQSDVLGNVGFSSANTFIVDNPPVVSLTSPARGSTTNRAQPRFSGTGGAQPGDASSVTIKVYARSGMTLTLIQTPTAPLGPTPATR